MAGYSLEDDWKDIIKEIIVILESMGADLKVNAVPRIGLERDLHLEVIQGMGPPKPTSWTGADEWQPPRAADSWQPSSTRWTNRDSWSGNNIDGDDWQNGDSMM